MSEKFEAIKSISHAFDGFKRKFWPIVGWVALPWLILIPVVLLIGFTIVGSLLGGLVGLEYAVETGNFNGLFLSGGFIATLVIFYLFFLLFGSWHGIYSARLGTQVLLGEDMRPSDARQRGFNRMASFLLVSVVVIAGYAVVGFAAVVAIKFLSDLGGLGIFLAIAVGIAFVVAMVYVGLGLGPIMFIMANEGLGFFALGRSWQLVSGNRWQLLGNMFLWMLIFAGIHLIYFLCVFTAGMLMTVSVALGLLLIFLIGTIFFCVMIALGTVVGPSIYLGLLKVEGLKAESSYA